MRILGSPSNKAVQERLIEVSQDFYLDQLQLAPTRENRNLDLYFTTHPGLTKNIQTIPGVSDHDVVLVDSSIQAPRNKKEPRNILLYGKANWTGMRTSTKDFATSFLPALHSRSVQDNWLVIKEHIQNNIKEHIPTKLVSSRYNLPWVTSNLRRLTRKKQRLYNAARKVNSTTAWDKYRKFKKDLAAKIKTAHNEYVFNTLNKSLEDRNTKPFWRYIKSRKQDNVGVAPLKKNGQLFYTSKEKASILSDQFTSVFSRENSDDIPHLYGPNYRSINSLSVEIKGVAKLLKDLNPSKAAGPDRITCRVLKELASELAPILAAFFQQSIVKSEIPADWKRAFVAPIYKKGNIHQAVNYRPVSLTCVCSKLLEHVVCKHIHNHLEHHGILSPLQHGFRRNHSCETQLLTTVEDFMYSWDQNVQVDIAILDLSKAFDTVPHKRLLQKLLFYGIDGCIHGWIRDFLGNRTQSVVIQGNSSPWADVLSGVPQGTVLGPLLFLLHINDLPAVVHSQVRLFADDCLIYRQIHSKHDQEVLQHDLNSLNTWAKTWGMVYNASKCNIHTLSRKKTSLSKLYHLDGVPLAYTQEAKYLGVLISASLKWTPHINSVCAKAGKTLSFMWRNLRHSPESLKITAYTSLIRPLLEYSATVWDPHLQKDIKLLESLQRRSVRFVKNLPRQDHTSITRIMQELKWPTLQQRRRTQRLCMFYKAIHGKAALSVLDHLLPSDTRTRSKHSQTFKLLPAKTTHYKNSFVPRTLIDWNALNQHTVDSPEIEAFRASLHQ
jgi:hypothetical protein